ncbi:MAG: DNA starvation/stationary phase protection protein [Anaerolineaceae bacterium]|nr:DNA starvation/stationary phase protection protein [Anaerolineaceae bacterium]
MEHIRFVDHNMKLKVLIQPNIGLEVDVRNSIVELLNKTLANEAVLTLKTRSAHWNTTGSSFFDLHFLFNSQYEQLNNLSNQMVEHVRILGGIAIGSLQEFTDHTRLEEQPGVVPDALHLLADHETVIRFLREDAKTCADEYEDEVTHNFLVEILFQHEKMAWMLRSYIEPELSANESYLS